MILIIQSNFVNFLEVLGTRDFISKYRKFELLGGRHKYVYITLKNDYFQGVFPIKHMFCVRKRNVSGSTQNICFYR